MRREIYVIRWLLPEFYVIEECGFNKRPDECEASYV